MRSGRRGWLCAAATAVAAATGAATTGAATTVAAPFPLPPPLPFPPFFLLGLGGGGAVYSGNWDVHG